MVAGLTREKQWPWHRDAPGRIGMGTVLRDRSWGIGSLDDITAAVTRCPYLSPSARAIYPYLFAMRYSGQHSRDIT